MDVEEHAEELRLRKDSNAKRDSWQISGSLFSSTSSIQMYRPKSLFQLHMFQKKEHKSMRQEIHSTKCQRLVFYRTFTTPLNKSGLLDSSIFNRVIWTCTLFLFLDSLSHIFIHIFLASYAPEEHIFLTKMVPFCIGYKFLLIAISFFEVANHLHTSVLIFQYFVYSILFKNPWNRCESSTYFDVDLNRTINCYQLEEFANQFGNMTYIFLENTYLSSQFEYFQLAHVEYFRLNMGPDNYFIDMAFFVFTWSTAAFLTYHASNSKFWKVLHYSHWSSTSIEICMFLYLIGVQSSTVKNFKIVLPASNRLPIPLDIFQSVSIPPVAHILTARSTQPVYPNSDSTAIAVSNAGFYIFKLLLGTKIVSHCENVIGIPLHHLEYNKHSFFLIWAILFSSFHLGDLFILIFLGLYSITTLLTATIAFRCIIEMVIYEWRQKIKPWMVILVMFFSAALVFTFIDYISQMRMNIYLKIFLKFFELVFLYVFYPLGRLFDDYTFHYGIPPTKLRKLGLQILPFWHMMIFILMILRLIYEIEPDEITTKKVFTTWCLYATLFLGMIFTIFKHLVKNKSINQIFNPDPDWGPKDYFLRQLRKQYDSRTYITSNESRFLSRYLMSKADPKVYKINVRYDFYHRKSYPEQLEVRFDDEKKNIDHQA